MKVRIKDIAEVINGSTPSTEHPEYYDGNIIWITPKDLSNQNSKYIYSGERAITQTGYNSCSTKMIPENNILMSSRAPIGLFAINKVECCTNQGFKSIIVDKTKCNVEYLYYYLKYHIKEIESLGSGTTFKEVSKDSMEKYEIELPSIEAQEKISTILTLLDDKIINNTKINAELESMAKTLYDYWFLQFEFPNEEGKPYKSSGGKMVWNEELKREIPEGWTIRTVLDCSNVVSGYPFKKETYSNEGRYNIYTIGNVQDGYIDDTCPNKIDFIPNDIDERCVLKPCDVIMSLTGNVGRVGIVYTKNALLNQRVLKVIPFDGYHNFLYLLFRNSSFMNVMQRIASGTSQKNLSPNQVCDFTFAVPNKNLLDLFNLKLNGFIDAIVNNLSQNQELTSLRDFLLPLLMNGQVTFKGKSYEQ